MKKVIKRLPVDPRYLQKMPLYHKWLLGGITLFLVLLLGLMLFIRLNGLPVSIQQRLLNELSSRGLSVHFSKIYLDPLARIVARDLTIFQTRDQKTTSIRVNRVIFSFNWLSWWRKEPFLSGAKVQDAAISIPITEAVSVRLDNVNAEVDLLQNSLVVRSSTARVGQLILRGQGNIILNGPPPVSTPPSQEELEKRAQLWQKIKGELDGLSGPIIVALQFTVPTSTPMESKINLDIQSRSQNFRGVSIKNIQLRASYAEKIIRLEQGDVNLSRGGVNLSGMADLNSKKGNLSLHSNLDLLLLSPALPATASDIVDKFRFTRDPYIAGDVECDWNSGFQYFARVNLDWKDFQIGNQAMDSMRFVASSDGRRFFITDCALENSTGKLSVELFRDEDMSIKGHVKSTLNPVGLKDVFGKGAKNFFDNVIFGKSPQIDCKIDGTDLRSLKFDGSVLLRNFTYRNGRGTTTNLDQLQSKFTFVDKVLTLPDLRVTRIKGEEGSAAVVYDFNNRLVYIKGAKTHLNVQKFTPLFGGKLEVYVQPYRFFEPPNLTIEGVVDLATEKKTNLKVRIESEKGMEYDFLKKTVVVTNIKSDLLVAAQHLTVKFAPPTTLFSGKFTGAIDLDLAKEKTPYKAELKFDKMDFDDVLKVYFNKEDVTGTVTAEAHLRGLLDDVKSLEGNGSLTVIDGDVYKIPVFGALSNVMSTIVPDAGYSKADRAKSDFSFSNGVITTSGLEIYSALFAVIGGGTYDYMNDNLNMSMRVNVRGIIGIPLFLISKLFEYQGTGGLASAKWEPKNF